MQTQTQTQTQTQMNESEIRVYVTTIDHKEPILLPDHVARKMKLIMDIIEDGKITTNSPNEPIPLLEVEFWQLDLIIRFANAHKDSYEPTSIEYPQLIGKKNHDMTVKRLIELLAQEINLFDVRLELLDITNHNTLHYRKMMYQKFWRLFEVGQYVQYKDFYFAVGIVVALVLSGISARSVRYIYNTKCDMSKEDYEKAKIDAGYNQSDDNKVVVSGEQDKYKSPDEDYTDADLEVLNKEYTQFVANFVPRDLPYPIISDTDI